MANSNLLFNSGDLHNINKYFGHFGLIQHVVFIVFDFVIVKTYGKTPILANKIKARNYLQGVAIP